MSETLELAKLLITYPSITPDDAGCQLLLAKRLSAIGFTIEHLPFGSVQNLWARRGTTAPLFVFAGHTDVVPPGPHWTSPPFAPEIRDGYLYGRGAVDMKGAIAAMLTACERFIAAHPMHPGSIGFLLTSDEEGPAIDGTRKVLEYLNLTFDACIVGEPSSQDTLGDTIKNGRRGSLSGKLTIHGIQGHIAYPERAKNPIHQSFGGLKALTETIWDRGNDDFSPTQFQLSNIHSGTGATNVTPGELIADFNFRYSTENTADNLKKRLHEILDQQHIYYSIHWTQGAEPFLCSTKNNNLIPICQAAIKTITGRTAALSTSGGTSDARFIAKMGTPVIELGLCNATIHQVDECVAIDDLEKLTKIYTIALEKILL
ncbi:MAG: succinyl-diaminopimelate desuccinylase [Gammaproteobacteria bacterium]